VGRNADLFPDVLRIYVPDGSSVLDATWGHGKFWTHIPDQSYRLVASDVRPIADIQADARQLPFHADTFDAVVFDPPYARHGTPMKESIARCYGNNEETAPTSVGELIKLYVDAIDSLREVLKTGGTLIIKVQDQIESGKQNFLHVPLLFLPGFRCEDLFILVQPTQPAMRQPAQKHARKNHSYFIVHRKLAA